MFQFLSKNKISLFAVTHKPVLCVPAGRKLIGVGANAHELGAAFTDDTGENIHSKNPFYCELTALYWIWKNDKSGIVGLEHYRRFFLSLNGHHRPLSRCQIRKILKTHDVIVSSPVNWGGVESVRGQYERSHIVSDLVLCEKIIKKNSPEFSPFFTKFFSEYSLSPFNMFVMRKPLLNEYCAWLFPLLAMVESELGDLSCRSLYQQRVFGFLAERLFNVWIMKMNLKVFYANIFDGERKPFAKRLKKQIKRIFSFGGKR